MFKYQNPISNPFPYLITCLAVASIVKPQTIASLGFCIILCGFYELVRQNDARYSDESARLAEAKSNIQSPDAAAMKRMDDLEASMKEVKTLVAVSRLGGMR